MGRDGLSSISHANVERPLPGDGIRNRCSRRARHVGLWEDYSAKTWAFATRLFDRLADATSVKAKGSSID